MSKSFGAVFVETYLEAVEAGYRTEVRDEELGLVLRHSSYDTEGRLVRSDWTNGDWETFSPFDCTGVSGNCTFRYISSLGYDITFKTKAVPMGNGFSVKTVSVEGGPAPDGYFQTGRFGLLTELRGKVSSRLIGMKNCDSGA